MLQRLAVTAILPVLCDPLVNLLAYQSTSWYQTVLVANHTYAAMHACEPASNEAKP